MNEADHLSESSPDHNSRIQLHRFIVHYLDKNENLEGRKFNSLKELREEAFACYEQERLSESNSILTYFDTHKKLVLLTNVPDILKNGQYRHLYIKSVSPVCHLCENPFGIVDDELLLECPNVKCSVQYCDSCVRSIQGVPIEYPFTCVVCRETNHPKRNALIDKHLIWPNMEKLYGTRSLLDLKKKSKFIFCQPLLTDIELRRIHLQSRLDTLRKKFKPTIAMEHIDEQMMNDVTKLCQKLENLTSEIKTFKRTTDTRTTSVPKLLEKYQKSMKNFDICCDTLLRSIKQLSCGDEAQVQIDTSDAYRQHIKVQYGVDKLKSLPSDENIESIDEILNDILFRTDCLSTHFNKFTSLFQTNPSSLVSAIDHTKEVHKYLHTLTEITQALQLLREHCRTMERFTREYFVLLTDETMPDIRNSRFIRLMERLRTRTEKLEAFSYFPATSRLMNEWKNDYGVDGNFKPKVIDLCKTIESDLKDLFTNNNYIYLLPYKIGAVGDTSTGKSALIAALSQTTQTAATILSERSTFGYLQIDTFVKYLNNVIIPLTFIDIEGAIDNDSDRAINNYKDMIMKSDCDLYIIVYDKQFTDFNQQCRDYIERTLGRRCLLVRSKVDIYFKQVYKEVTKRLYSEQNCGAIELDNILRQIRDQSSITFKDDERLENVFLTAAGQHNELQRATFAQFDLEKLRRKLVKTAVNDCRIERICKLAVLTSKTVINTCFRRGYAVSKTQYRWLAASASLIPGADEIPAFFGREKIRQAFGIHDNFAVTNIINQTNDSLEEYLMKHHFTVPEAKLKSGYFQYLRSNDQDSPKPMRDSEQSQSVEVKPVSDGETGRSKRSKIRRNYRVGGSKILSVGVATIGGIGRVADDGLRVVVPAAAGALRVTSIVGIVVGAVLTPVFAAWAFYNTGNRMNEHLHLLCDDLQTVLTHFIVRLCNQSCENIPPPYSSSSDEETSSEDEL